MVTIEKKISLYVLFKDLDGCASRDNSKKEQVFPMIMKSNCPVFQFRDCSFEVQKDREGAARVILINIDSSMERVEYS